MAGPHSETMKMGPAGGWGPPEQAAPATRGGPAAEIFGAVVMSDKPRVAFFDFACCEGCQLTVLGMGDSLLEILDQVDVVTWREAISEKSNAFDIAIVEGSITRDSDVDRLKRIRERASCLIALGACATLGGVHVLGNRFDRGELLELVYGKDGRHFEAGEVRPISAVVPVDYLIHGCPVNPDEFITVVTHVLLGRPYHPPNRSVCFECKLRENECVFERGQICLGPVTRCGCNAICTSFGRRCFGCRGLIDDPNLNAARDVLEEHGYTIDDIVGMFDIYSLASSPAATIRAK